MKLYLGKGFAVRFGLFCIGFGTPKGLREDIEALGVDLSRRHGGRIPKHG